MVGRERRESPVWKSLEMPWNVWKCCEMSVTLLAGDLCCVLWSITALFMRHSQYWRDDLFLNGGSEFLWYTPVLGLWIFELFWIQQHRTLVLQIDPCDVRCSSVWRFPVMRSFWNLAWSFRTIISTNLTKSDFPGKILFGRKPVFYNISGSTIPTRFCSFLVRKCKTTILNSRRTSRDIRARRLLRWHYALMTWPLLDTFFRTLVFFIREQGVSKQSDKISADKSFGPNSRFCCPLIFFVSFKVLLTSESPSFCSFSR